MGETLKWLYIPHILGHCNQDIFPTYLVMRLSMSLKIKLYQLIKEMDTRNFCEMVK